MKKFVIFDLVLIRIILLDNFIFIEILLQHARKHDCKIRTFVFSLYE